MLHHKIDNFWALRQGGPAAELPAQADLLAWHVYEDLPETPGTRIDSWPGALSLPDTLTQTGNARPVVEVGTVGVRGARGDNAENRFLRTTPLTIDNQSFTSFVVLDAEINPSTGTRCYGHNHVNSMIVTSAQRTTTSAIHEARAFIGGGNNPMGAVGSAAAAVGDDWMAMVFVSGTGTRRLIAASSTDWAQNDIGGTAGAGNSGDECRICSARGGEEGDQLLYECGIYDRPLITSELQELFDYFAGRYGTFSFTLP